MNKADIIKVTSESNNIKMNKQGIFFSNNKIIQILSVSVTW